MADKSGGEEPNETATLSIRICLSGIPADYAQSGYYFLTLYHLFPGCDICRLHHADNTQFADYLLHRYQQRSFRLQRGETGSIISCIIGACCGGVLSGLFAAMTGIILSGDGMIWIIVLACYGAMFSFVLPAIYRKIMMAGLNKTMTGTDKNKATTRPCIFYSFFPFGNHSSPHCRSRL